jgi:hypothetical protein
MRRYGGQTPEEARAEANDFVHRKICFARELEDQGSHTRALIVLAEAMHTVQDSASPSHTGFQPAWPDTNLQMLLNAGHYIGEQFNPGSNSVAAQNTRAVWDAFNNRGPMPRDFFNNGYDPMRFSGTYNGLPWSVTF